MFCAIFNWHNLVVCTLGCVTFFRLQGILKATVSGVLEDLKFKISEGSDQNWSCPDSALLAVSASWNTPETLAFNIPWYLEV